MNARVYYSEWDPFAAQWLRNLIGAGLIPAGDVDERSIADVQPDDLIGYDQCHFFAGLGIWAYALRLSGWGDRPVWTGSCPCQPFSVAGFQAGFDDPRHLWPEWKRLIAERRPSVLFGEQVSAAAQWLRLVRSDLETLGYAVGAIPIEAASAGADHFRDRYWFVADRDFQQPGEGVPRSGELGRTGGDQENHPGAVAHGDGQRPQIPFREPGDTGSERAAAEGNRVRAVEYMPGERRDWGANTPEQAGWFGAQIANIDGLYYLECPDGKWRRLPPPRVRWLGTRIPARTSKLRAIGNAIDPRPAQAFIQAYLGTR